MQLEESKEAVRHCRKAVGFGPKNAEAHRALAIALMGAGQYAEAESTLRKAIQNIEPTRQWQLQLVLSRILVRMGDDNNKDRELYGEALKHVKAAQRMNPNADVYFHAGVVHFKLDEYSLARRSFAHCLRENRDRFDAQRYGKIVEGIITQQRRISKGNTWGGWSLSIFCVIALIILWTVHFRGSRIQVPNTEAAAINANQNSNTGQNATPAQNANSAQTGTAPGFIPANISNAARSAARRITTSRAGVTPQNGNVTAGAGSAVDSNAKSAVATPESRQAETPGRLKEELLVDKSTLTVLTPILLGLMVVGLLLPNLNKIKLFGGIEAELGEVKTKETISSGPKGDIGFESSLPTVSPGPGGR